MGIYKNLFQKINKTDELLLIVMLNNIISNSILYQKPKVCYQFLIKLILTILFILFGFLVFAQKNTISIKDTSITNFMKWLIKSDKTFKAVRNIDNDVSEIKIENFIYYDSIETKNNFTSQNIFKKENKIHQYFTKTDADNFLLQIRRQSRSKWNLKIKNTIFLDTVELINNRLDKILYLYSFPLFSVDKKYVIIIESFYCGLLCGGGSYNLYERETNASWKKIKRFNIWAE